MANSSQTPNQPASEDLPFENAIARLEAIVEAMESGDVPLADLLAKYEEGTRLLAICDARLKTAELRIEQLKRHKDGSLTTEPFTSDETNRAD